MSATPSILLYFDPAHKTGLKLKSMVETIVLKEYITIVQDLEQLICILRQPLNGIATAIILAGSEKELLDLITFRDLLLRIPVILILPNQKKETITKGHTLRPRYLTYTDSNLSDVRDVFKKIVGKAFTAWH